MHLPSTNRRLALGLLCSLEAFIACNNTQSTAPGEDAAVDSGNLPDGGADGGIDEQLVWIVVPPGEFAMGNDEGKVEEGPEHSVNVPEFELNRTEITITQYRACVNEDACSPPGTDSEDNCNWAFDERYEHPVDCVSWFQAAEFCQWAGARLPSEAEWEYAARRAGQEISYPWGNVPSFPSCSHVIMSEDPPSGDGCGEWSTWPVCSKPAGSTDLDICDLAGNVQEWVQDWFHSQYTDAPDDGSAWEVPSGVGRVMRGASYRIAPSEELNRFRTTAREQRSPDLQAAGYGFRCAR